MRLSPDQIQIIRQTIADDLGQSAQVVLFGSRLDDAAKGGDIDLMVTLPDTIGLPTMRAARLAAKLERRLDGRRVDVVLVTPETRPQPIHQIARHHGVPL
jgi:predicted nucleotidyltransferase